MKRKLLLIILLLIPFGVFAKESISYGWEKESVEIEFIVEENNQYLVYEPNEVNYYSASGQKIKSVDLNTFGEENLQVLRDTHYEINYVYTETDTQKIYAYPGENFIDFCPKPTNDNLNPECEGNKITNLSESDQKKYTRDYYFFVKYYIENDESFRCRIINNYYVIYREHDLDENISIEVYDSNEEKIIEKSINGWIKSLDVNDTGIYIITTSYDDINKQVSYNLDKYNLRGEKDYSEDLASLISEESAYTMEDLYFYSIYYFKAVKNGIVLNLISEKASTRIQTCMDNYLNNNPNASREEAYDSCKNNPGTVHTRSTKKDESGNEDSSESDDAKPAGGVIERICPTILIKLNLEYSIETVVTGNGEIKVASNSEPGEGVTFEIIPKEGYVLGEVKVTDAYGNVLTFTDYTFTMPSSDVLIEVTFIPINPNTKDIAVIILLLFAIACGLLILHGGKKVRWLRQ